MARYRFLAAVYADRLYQPGEIADMPASFVPSAACEPLDAQATAVFFAIDPAPPPLVRQHWSDALLQTYPTTFWRPVDAAREMWELTGLGRGLGVKRWTSDADRLNSP